MERKRVEEFPLAWCAIFDQESATLLLLLIVIALNLPAVALRNRLRKRYAVSGL